MATARMFARLALSTPRRFPAANSAKALFMSTNSNDSEPPQERVIDTSFMTNDLQSKEKVEGVDVTFVGALEPEYPENWEELLARAEASYPERGGPRRNRRAEREKNRRWVIDKQHKVAKKQKIAKHELKQHKIKTELYNMRKAYVKYGYPPAVYYAQAIGNASSVGLGGRLGDTYFGPLFRDGNFDPLRSMDGSEIDFEIDENSAFKHLEDDN
mmetsp:Transcript_4911/g.6358  ORF Transcript_4911/g.6358 Transcript_4911/m.6358 type:complete len:214 (-) Transcript_4911:139-780(-)